MNRAVVAIISAISLTGCVAGPTWQAVRKDVALYDQVRRVVYIDPRDVAVACMSSHGLPTRDAKACFVQRRGVCLYITPPYDTRHDEELTAYCNGYRKS